MNISTETIGRLLASARGYTQWFVGFCTSLGLISAANSKTLTDSFAEVWNGVSMIVHGFTSIWQVGVVVLGPIIAVVLAKWSSNTAKTANQAAAVQAAVVDPNTPISPAVKETIITTAKAV
jgi:short subunit fatty acids transporter